MVCHASRDRRELGDRALVALHPGRAARAQGEEMSSQRLGAPVSLTSFQSPASSIFPSFLALSNRRWAGSTSRLAATPTPCLYQIAHGPSPFAGCRVRRVEARDLVSGTHRGPHRGPRAANRRGCVVDQAPHSPAASGSARSRRPRQRTGGPRNVVTLQIRVVGEDLVCRLALSHEADDRCYGIRVGAGTGLRARPSSFPYSTRTRR